jgi:hypothetical protein
MFQEKGEVEALADDAPGLGPAFAAEKQAMDALCTLRKKWLSWLMVERLVALQEQTISEDVGQFNTRSGLDSRWEMVDERRVQHYCCQRCPAPRQNSTMG